MKQVCGIWLPEDDVHFISHVWENGDYQREAFQNAMQYVKTPKLFFDVGAHVGLWTMMAHRAGFKEIRAFEPNPKTFACLEKNTEGLESISVFNYGIAERAGEMELVEDHAGNSGAISVKEVTDESITRIKVRHINYDNIGISQAHLEIKPHETLVKIDTEGMESQCVLGMEQVINALRPVVIVEQRRNYDALGILQQLGMEVVRSVRSDYILTWKKSDSTPLPLFINEILAEDRLHG